MGAISDDLMDSGFAVTQSIHGQRITILSGTDIGKVFDATLLVAPAEDLEMEQGGDSREKVIAHFAKNSFPALKPMDQLRDAGGQKWKVVERVSNPADTTVDFAILKIVAGKDE